MNQKITFPELVNAVAEATKTSKRVSEDFLKELFSLVASTLASGESVKIKRLGTFKTTVVERRKSINVSTGEEFFIPEHRKISFTPDKELAEAVNQPFAAFETVELADDVTEEMLNAVGEIPQETISEDTDKSQQFDNSIGNHTIEPKIRPEPIAELPQIEWDDTSDDDDKRSASKDNTDNEDNEDNNIEENSFNNDNEKPESELQQSTTEPITNDDYNIEENNEENDDEPTKEKKKSFLSGYIWGILSSLVIIGIVAAIIYLFNPQIFNSLFAQKESSEIVVDEQISIDTTIIDSIANEDTIKTDNNIPVSKEELQEPAKIGESTPTVETHPSDQPVYDTISRTRFLTTMAKEHYGNYHLWPYIYEENKKILGHPDRIKPGTKVVIPPLSKYGIDAKDKECIEKAKQKGAEIYSRYKKK